VSEDATTEKVQTERLVPAWALKSLKEFLNQLRINDEVLELCMRGIGMITSMPQSLTALTRLQELADESDKGPEITECEVDLAKSLSALAQREISSDFAILRARSLVFVWNGLESLVKDILRDWIVNKSEILAREPWASQKVRIGEYEPLDVEQRAAYVVELIDQSIGGPMKQGISRFENLLAMVCLGGSVGDELRKSLFELQQIRNVLVHRSGIVDRKLCDSCPWLQLKIGDPLVIGRKQHYKYANAVGEYVLELVFRTGEAFGAHGVRGQILNDE
jgi:hypothetical protein